MGFFNRPLSGGFRSSGFPNEHGFTAETFDTPATVNSEYGRNTQHPGPNNSPGGEFDANTTELFQGDSSMPGYVGKYEPGFHAAPGMQPFESYTAPAPGSEDLLMPRDTGGIPGTNRQITNAGPVESGSTEQWTGNRDELYSQSVGISGPVAGGPDYSGQLMAAWAHNNAALIDQAAAEAAMVAAV